MHSLSKEVIHEYKGDHSTKEKLTEIMNAFQYPQLIQLSPTLFSVYGPPTSSNPIGFVHVTIGNGKVECSSSDCKGYGSVMRQQKNKKICIHCHILLCFYSLATLIPTPSCSSSMLAPGSDTVAESPSPEVVKTSSQLECNDMESETLTSRQSTIELNMLNTLPYQIPRNIFDRIALNDSRSIDSENGKEGWPVTYCPECDCCRLCGSQLSIPRPHPGQKTGAVSYLLTNAYLSTLPVLPGVSKFFIKSPGLQVRAPNLPGKSAASLEFFFFINFVVFKMSKRKIKQEVYSVLFFELFTIGKRKTENRAVKLRFI